MVKDANKMPWLARAVARRRASYQQFFSRVAHKTAPVSVFASASDVVKASGNGRFWREDSGPMGDRWIHPGVTQHRLNIGERTGSYDGDDHALYHVAALIKSGLCETAWLGFAAWRTPDDHFGAHVVALWRDEDGARWWMDYREPAPFLKEIEWAEAVARHRGKLVSFASVEVSGLSSNDTVQLDRRSIRPGSL